MFAGRSPASACGFAKNFVTKQCDGCFAGRQAVPRQQVGDGTIRGAFLPQLDYDIFCREQFVEFLRPARREFLDCLADFAGIKCGHIEDAL